MDEKYLSRRRAIKDWLIGLNTPEAETLLNSLNQMYTDDWEQKHRRDLRKLKGYADLEKSTISLRDRARGEFDTYVDNPEWYIKGKAAKLGVNIDDLKKTLDDLQKEKEYFEGRERRKQEVKDDFKWNFASDWAKQRYIDTPEKSYWNNPELSVEHIPDVADAAAGFAAGLADFLPGIGGTFAGPAIRAGRNAVQGQNIGDVMTNFAADAGANAGVDYLPTLILNKARKVAQKGATQVEKYASLGNDIDNSKKTLNAARDVFKNTNATKLRNLDPNEISKFKANIEALPDSPAKRDILNIINQKPSEAIDAFKTNLNGLGLDADNIFKLVEERGIKLNADPSYNLGRAKAYTEVADAQIKQSKNVPDKKFNPYDEQGQIRKDGLWNNELGQTILNRKALGQGMSKGAKIGAKAYQVGTKVGPGLVKTSDTAAGKRQPVKQDKNRADIDWYKENYSKDWSMGFAPHGREDEPIMKAYREWQNENRSPSISDVFY